MARPPIAVLLIIMASCGSRNGAPGSPAVQRTDERAPEAPPDLVASNDDDLVCEPVSIQCGCEWQCALLRLTDGALVRLDSEGEQQFVRDDCSAGPCFEVCEGDRCGPALVVSGEECEESCPPARAPFACKRVPGQPIDATGTPCAQAEAP